MMNLTLELKDGGFATINFNNVTGWIERTENDIFVQTNVYHDDTGFYGVKARARHIEKALEYHFNVVTVKMNRAEFYG